MRNKDFWGGILGERFPLNSITPFNMIFTFHKAICHYIYVFISLNIFHQVQNSQFVCYPCKIKLIHTLLLVILLCKLYLEKYLEYIPHNYH